MLRFTTKYTPSLKNGIPYRHYASTIKQESTKGISSNPPEDLPSNMRGYYETEDIRNQLESPNTDTTTSNKNQLKKDNKAQEKKQTTN